MTESPRNRASVQERLAWVFGAFLLLVVVSVALTFWGIRAQEQDAQTINLAGRQRLLVQQMARLAVEVDYEDEVHHEQDLRAAMGSFDLALNALRNGGSFTERTGQSLVLTPPNDAGVLNEVAALEPAWKTFRAGIDNLLATGSGAGVVSAQAPALIERADHLVQAYEALAQRKLAQLRTVQIGFLLAGCVLLGAGWQLVRSAVVRPIQQLEQAARRIGEGDLESPLTVSGPTEVEALAGEMERTRRQLLASRQELQSWANTLEKRVQQRTAELDALATVSREITSHLDIGGVLISVTEKAQHLLDSEVAELCLLDPQAKRLNLHATTGPEAALMNDSSPVGDRAVCVLLQGNGARACDSLACPGFCEVLSPAYRASHLAAPLRIGERVLGALCVGSSRRDAFRPEAVTLLTQMTESAAVALENSRLYEQAEGAATLIERERLASEMHDGLLQTLNFLRWMVRRTQEQLSDGKIEEAQLTLQKIERANAQAESEIRRAISSLQEAFPSQVMLQDQLAAVVDDLNTTMPPIQFENGVGTPILLPRHESEQALRVVREALLNAQRYSGAPQIWVGLRKEGDELVLAVQDEGRGFDPGCLPIDDRPHFGIKIMQARAAHLGGTIQIQSAPGQGTRVSLRWTPEGNRHE